MSLRPKNQAKYLQYTAPPKSVTSKATAARKRAEGIARANARRAKTQKEADYIRSQIPNVGSMAYKTEFEKSLAIFNKSFETKRRASTRTSIQNAGASSAYANYIVNSTPRDNFTQQKTRTIPKEDVFDLAGYINKRRSIGLPDEPRSEPLVINKIKNRRDVKRARRRVSSYEQERIKELSLLDDQNYAKAQRIEESKQFDDARKYIKKTERNVKLGEIREFEKRTVPAYIEGGPSRNYSRRRSGRMIQTRTPRFVSFNINTPRLARIDKTANLNIGDYF